MMGRHALMENYHEIFGFILKMMEVEHETRQLF